MTKYEDYGIFLNSMSKEEWTQWNVYIKDITKKILKKAKKTFKKQTNDQDLIESSLSFLESEITTDYIYNPVYIKKEGKSFYKWFFGLCKEVM